MCQNLPKNNNEVSRPRKNTNVAIQTLCPKREYKREPFSFTSSFQLLPLHTKIVGISGC